MTEFLDKPQRLESTLPEFDIALRAATEAGKEIMKVYTSDFTSEKKADDSPITLADLKSNKIIKEILSKTKIKILSEEDKDDKRRLDEDKIWIVDPLDGTSDFIKKTGEFTVMIGLVQKKKPILGVIYVPTQNILFASQKKCGAWRYSNGSWTSILVSKISKLSQCRAVGSRYHISENEKKILEKLKIAKFTSVGSSLKVAKISSGEAEVYFTSTNKIKEWDTCASYSILSEAGGKMTDVFGNDLFYNCQNVSHQNGILATNGLIHEEMIKEIKKSK